MVKPLRSSHASPASFARSQSPPSTSEMMRPRPRFGTSRIIEPLPLCGILRADGDEVGGELDFAVFQVDGVVQIDDALVVRVGDRKREVDASGDALVGSGVAELLAVEDIGAGCNFDSDDARVQGRNN